MTKTPRVSVLMPAYNVEKYIGEAIESILNQTFTDFEFIIINDGSTDNTAQIIEKYAKKDKRIKFINNKKNQGIVAVLNQGLELCQGEYIARMDSDDISLLERFSKQVEYMDKYRDCGVLGTAIKHFGADNKQQTYKQIVTFLDMCYANPIAHPSAMIRKSILDRFNIKYDSNYKAAEDYKLWADLIKITEIHNLSQVLLNYRVHQSSISCTQNVVQSNNTKRIQAELLNFLTNIPEFKNKLGHIIHDHKFYDKTQFCLRMFIQHPLRWLIFWRK